MNIGIHILQQYPLSNPNRDMNGAPKCYVLGDKKRQMISPQCLARSIRNNPQYLKTIDDKAQEAYLSRDFSTLIQEIAAVEGLTNVDEIIVKFDDFIWAGDRSKGKGKSKSKGKKNADSTTAEASEDHKPSEANDDSAKPAADKKDRAMAYLGNNEVATIVRAIAAGKTFDEIKKDLESVVNIDTLFLGRMFADPTLSELNIHKALLVGPATAVSGTEFYDDDFVAADDLSSNGGAGHLGSRTSAAPLYYRHANIDVSNLDAKCGKFEVKNVIEAAIRGIIFAQPSGHMGQFANYAIPDYVFVTFGENNYPLDLTKSYIDPIKPDAQSAVNRLHDHFNAIVKAYEIETKTIALAPMVNSPIETAESVSQLVSKVLESY